MGFRFRLGPFTFGKSGTRLSLWKGGTGISIPLFNKGSTFGKVKAGPVIGFFSNPIRKSPGKQNHQDNSINFEDSFSAEEKVAIEAFGNDKHLISKLKKYGVPWRSVQEILQDALPEHINDRNNVAYKLVPKAMRAVFGKTEYYLEN